MSKPSNASSITIRTPERKVAPGHRLRLDRAFLEEAGQLPLQHPNIRGQGYYH